MPEGCDISEFQASVPDCEFVIIRGWSGYREDNRFASHWADAKARGIPRGVYGYVVENDPVGQADALMALVKDDPPELGYWSDIEEPGLTFDAAHAHIDRLRQTGRVGFYSNVPDYHGILQDGAGLSDLPWWVAGYGPNDGTRHALNPAPPRPYTIHQYSSAGGLDRNYADTLDWFNQGDDFLMALTADQQFAMFLYLQHLDTGGWEGSDRTAPMKLDTTLADIQARLAALELAAAKKQPVVMTGKAKLGGNVNLAGQVG